MIGKENTGEDTRNIYQCYWSRRALEAEKRLKTMKFTSQIPTKPGFYWFIDSFLKPQIVEKFNIENVARRIIDLYNQKL